jgi:hypothetical protein
MTVDREELSDAKLALVEQRLGGETSGNGQVSLVTPRRQSGHIPLSVAQEQLWYFSQLAPDNPIYNELVTIRKTGAFDRDAFKTCVQRAGATPRSVAVDVPTC